MQKCEFRGDSAPFTNFTVGSALSTQATVHESSFKVGRRVRIEDSLFRRNKARGEPVSIRGVLDVGLYNVTMDVDESYDVDSGVVIGQAMRAVVRACQFVRNQEVGGLGAALSIMEVDYVHVSDTRFENNHADTSASSTGRNEGEGGALYISGARTWAYVEKCQFINNTAASHGGALLIDRSCAPRLQGNQFINNSAGISGGAATVRLGELFDTCVP